MSLCLKSQNVWTVLSEDLLYLLTWGGCSWILIRIKLECLMNLWELSGGWWEIVERRRWRSTYPFQAFLHRLNHDCTKVIGENLKKVCRPRPGKQQPLWESTCPPWALSPVFPIKKKKRLYLEVEGRPTLPPWGQWGRPTVAQKGKRKENPLPLGKDQK